MTDDELDLLASAYLDGEATSEEVAMVERDPQLLARVEELRVVMEQVSIPVPGPDPAVKEQHLAAALAAFSVDADAGPAAGAESADSATEVAPVIDLTERAKQPRSNNQARPMSAAGSSSGRSMPRWLPAAAALLVVAGAGALLINQGVGSSDLGESADAVADTEASEESADQGALAGEASTDAEAMEMESETVMADEAMEEEAMEDEEAMEEDSDDEAADDGAADSDARDDDASSSAPAEEEGGFFPEEPVLVFDAVPDANQVMQELELPLREDLLPSECADLAAGSIDGEVLGYLPIEVAGAPAEFFVLFDQDGAETSIIFDVNTCTPLTP